MELGGTGEMGKATTMDDGELRGNEGSIKLHDFFEC